MVLVMVFIFWPLMDKSEKTNILKRPLMLATFLGTIVVWIVLTIWGAR